jgi:hypothetical protein
MMARIAAALIFVSMAILLRVAVMPDGASAILFSFVGHPLLLMGLVLAVIALSRRLARERTMAAANRVSSRQA